MGKDAGKNISQNVSVKDSQKFIHHAKQSATDALKTTWKWVKTAEATCDLIGSKISDEITIILQQNNSKTIANEN